MSKKMSRYKKWKILVTPKEAGESLALLEAEFLKKAEIFPTHGRLEDPGKLVRLLKNKDGVVLDLERISSDILKFCPKLSVISRFGEGCDAIDLESTEKFNVKVTRTRAVSSLAVARHAMAFISALMHNITENDRNLKKSLWLRKPNISGNTNTLGILGFGKIGETLACLATTFGFKVLVYDKRKIRSKYKTVNDLEEFLSLSNIVSLHVPLTAETKNIISGKIIKRLKGKYLVNTARGGLVDEAALLRSLEKGRVLGYATDVFSREPISGISRRIARNEKVISSPHIAALDKTTAIDMTRRALENALHCLNNEHEKVVSYVTKP